MTGLNGRCLCGEVRFTARPKPAAGICHCSMCRQWTGGMFISVELEEAPVYDNRDRLGVYRSSEWGERVFCPKCGSSLIWRSVDGVHHVASVQCFENPAAFPLESEIFIDEKPDSYSMAGERSRMTGAEFMAMIAPNQEG